MKQVMSEDFSSDEKTIGNFGWALSKLKYGFRMCRSGWNGKNMWVEMQKPDENSKMTSPYFYLELDPSFYSESRTPWIPSTGDLLAEDWEVYKI